MSRARRTLDRLRRRRVTFTAATYNVYHRTKVAAIVQTITRVTREYGVTVWLLQEATQRGLGQALEAAGWSWRHVDPEFMIAWDSDEWTHVRHRELVLSPTKYWALSKALVVVLRNNRTGRVSRRVKFMTYHTPAHVQTAKLRSKFRRAWQALRESVARWNELASNTLIACCFGGDDNAVERGRFWRWMVRGPLKQVQAPEGTHGKRPIDDFRIRKLTAEQPGWVESAPGDHDIHIRRFTTRGRAA